LDGTYHRFPDEQAVRLWLSEDEYSLLAQLIEGGDVGEYVVPPTAASDRELVPLMATRPAMAGGSR